jgi:DNA-binding NtrC family response regulator
MLPTLRLVSDDSSYGPGSRDHQGRSPKTGNGHDRKPTILIVEDEILIRLASADYLRNGGYRVLEASNAIEAQSVFAVGEPIELVFSDVSMPGTMSGIALARWVQHQFPDVKVLLTAGESGTEEASALSDGPFLRKPYSHDILLAKVRHLLMA